MCCLSSRSLFGQGDGGVIGGDVAVSQMAETWQS